MKEIKKLNPGIRNLVYQLNAWEFKTIDSGDGETHYFECDRNYPYVSILTENKESLCDEADRLMNLLWSSYQIEIFPQHISHKPSIQASYDPANKIAIIDLMGVLDKDLL